MMRRTSNPASHRLITVLLAALLAFAAGCASKNVPVEDAEDTMDSEFSDGSDSTTTPVPDSSGQDTRVSAVDIRIPAIYFDYDESEIRSEFRTALSAGARSIKDADATVLISGHCDERGSEEYNFALGERRAGAVRKYLYNLGVPLGQMTIVSYGETRPAVKGRGEGAWRLNRRAEFKLR
jgi:peptidoglycan-associated lipoprotein